MVVHVQYSVGIFLYIWFLMKYLIVDVLAVDLLEKMMVLDTDKRITAADSLAHSYFAQYHDPDDEPEAEPFDQSFESRELDIEEWKRESMVSARFIKKMTKSAFSNLAVLFTWGIEFVPSPPCSPQNPHPPTLNRCYFMIIFILLYYIYINLLLFFN